jgi:excisionase family DNA binding protein
MPDEAVAKRGWTLTNAPPIIEKLLTYKQAGTLLGVTERTVWTLVNDGELPAVRFGRSVRIDPADLRAYIDRCKTPAKGVDHDPR